MSLIATRSERSDVIGSLKYVKQAVYLQQDKWVDPWRENSFLVPLPCRWTSSAVSHFVPSTALRSRSARPAPLSAPPTPGYGMQRHQSRHNSSFGVAKFCDWSPDVSQERDDNLSIARLYQEFASVVGASSPRQFSDKAKVGGGGVTNGGGPGFSLVASGGSVGTRLNPGRMFLRDKGMLTKGEREIIEGIYRNRGDLKKDGAASPSQSDFYVRSHHDAWLIGKPGLGGNKPSTEIPRQHMPRGGLLEVMVPTSETASQNTTPRGVHQDNSEEGTHQPLAKHTCIMCLKEQHLLYQLQQQKHQQYREQHHSKLNRDSSIQNQDSYLRRGRPQQIQLHHPNPQLLLRERGHQLNHYQKQQQQQLSMSFTSLPMPVHAFWEEEGPQAPPTSPSSKLFTGSLAPSVLSSSSASTSATNGGAQRLPSKRHDLIHRLSVICHLQHHHGAGGDDCDQSDSEEGGILNPDGQIPGGARSKLEVARGGGGRNKKKLQVKIFLPQVVSDPSEDVEVKLQNPQNPQTGPLSTIVMQGTPALARSEHHLSHSDLSEEQASHQNRAGGPNEGSESRPYHLGPSQDNLSHGSLSSSSTLTIQDSRYKHRNPLPEPKPNNNKLGDPVSERKPNNNNSSKNYQQHIRQDELIQDVSVSGYISPVKGRRRVANYDDLYHNQEQNS